MKRVTETLSLVGAYDLKSALFEGVGKWARIAVSARLRPFRRSVDQRATKLAKPFYIEFHCIGLDFYGFNVCHENML